MELIQVKARVKKLLMEYGTSASGFWGHAGRPGEIGGSASPDSRQLSLTFGTNAGQLNLPFGQTSPSRPMTFNPGQQLKLSLGTGFKAGGGRGRRPGPLAVNRDVRDQEFATHMANGVLKNAKSLGGGISDTYIIKVEFNGKVEKCLFKDPNAEYGVQNCLALHELDKLSGLNITPPVTAKTYENMKDSNGREKTINGVAQEWVNGKPWGKWARDKEDVYRDFTWQPNEVPDKKIDIGLRKLAILDYISCSTDRHTGNFVVGSTKAMKLWATDNDMCFHHETRNSAPLRYVQKIAHIKADYAKLTNKEKLVLRRIIKNKDKLSETLVRLYGEQSGRDRYDRVMRRTENLLRIHNFDLIKADD